MEMYSEIDHQAAIARRLATRNGGYVPFKVDEEQTIAELFDIQVNRYPLKPAVSSGGRSLNYSELAGKSRSVASALERVKVAENSQVAILAKDQCNFVAAMLGVIRAGGCYLPIDPAFAEERNVKILNDSNATVILAERSQLDIAKRMQSGWQRIVILEEAEDFPDDAVDFGKPGNFACLIYTSGSTGQPKGVIQSQRNLLQVVRRYSDSLCLGAGDRVALLSSCSVTASVGTILGTILNGATLCGCAALDMGLNRIADWIDSQGITIYRSVPSLFRELMSSIPVERKFASVQIVRIGGDSLYRQDWDLFRKHFATDCVLVNFYGCSEISTVSRFYMDSASQLSEGVLPVGYPLEGVEIAVVSDEGSWHRVAPRHVQEGSIPISGEIVIRSKYVALGYWNKDLGDISSSWQCSEDQDKIYRTGDFGSLRASHGLVHLGREDSQVKVAGFRIEIAEVEACLRNHVAVRDAAVVAITLGDVERDLVGFVVLGEEPSGIDVDVRSYVSERLPSHMVPSEVLIVDKIPRTRNDKVDRSALVKIREDSRIRKIRVPPDTRTEQDLVETWREVIGIGEIGVEDDFFEFGGGSLLALRIAAKVSERIGVEIPVHSIYQFSTIRTMAAYIDQVAVPLQTSAPLLAPPAEFDAGSV